MTKTRKLQKNRRKTFESLREGVTWGTYGINGDQPITYIPIKDLSTSHIVAILETQWHISDELGDLMAEELDYRITEGEQMDAEENQ